MRGMSRRPSVPLSALALAALGLPCLAYGVALLFGAGHFGHPLLLEPGAGIAFAVTGVALVGSAGFPFVLRRLANAEEQADS
jgi:hypothetical protein